MTGRIMLDMGAASDEAVAREADWNAVLAGTATPEQREAAILYAAECAGWSTTSSPDASPDSGEAENGALLMEALNNPEPVKIAEGEYAYAKVEELPAMLRDMAGDALFFQCEPHVTIDAWNIARMAADELEARLARPSSSPAIVKEAGEVEAVPSHPREGVRPAYSQTMVDLLDAYEQRVWVWAQGCYIDGISQRSQTGDSYNEGQRDDVSKARSALIRQIDALTRDDAALSASNAAQEDGR